MRDIAPFSVGLAIVCAGCSFSFSIGGFDYEELEEAIAEELTTTYSDIDQTVTKVSCPRSQEEPDPGDSFECVATLGDGDDVPVAVVVEDDGASFETLATVHRLSDAAVIIADDLTLQFEDETTVDCGDGVLVGDVGDTFECTASDANSGAVRVVTVTITEDGIDYEVPSNFAAALIEKITPEYERAGVTVESATCPDVAVGAPTAVVCELIVVGGQRPVQISLRVDADGDASFDSLDDVFAPERVVAFLDQDLTENSGVPVTADCGKEILVVEIGRTFECTATDGAVERPVIVTAQGDGDITYELG